MHPTFKWLSVVLVRLEMVAASATVKTKPGIVPVGLDNSSAEEWLTKSAAAIQVEEGNTPDPEVLPQAPVEPAAEVSARGGG